jgi:hypothetical protein
MFQPTNQESPEQRLISATFIQDMASKTKLMHYFCLFIIYEREYYIELGYNSFEEYIKDTWNYTHSTAFNHLKIAKTLQNTLNICLSQNESNIVGLLDVHNKNLDDFMDLPYTKQLILSQMDQNKFNKMIETGKVNFVDGSFTIKELKTIDRESLWKFVKGVKSLVIKKESETKALLTFEKVYSNVEKYFIRIAIDTSKCELISIPHKEMIEKKIQEIVEIFDIYKPADKK